MLKAVAGTDDLRQRDGVVERFYRLVRRVAAEADHGVDLERRPFFLVHRPDMLSAWSMAGLAPNVRKGSRGGAHIIRASRAQEAGHVAAHGCGVRPPPLGARRRRTQTRVR